MWTKKTAIAVLLLFSTFICQAQKEPVFNDFAKNVKEITEKLHFNDNITVYEVKNDNDNFDVVAVDNNLNLLWRTNLKGYCFTIANFKGKILAVACTQYTNYRLHNNTYKGFLLDSKTGNVTLEKVIYQGQQQYLMDVKIMRTEDGSSFKMALTQTEFERRVHFGIALPVVTIFPGGNPFAQMKSMTDMLVMDYDENLNVSNTLKPVAENGYLVDMAASANGDLALVWYTGGVVTVDMYKQGKTTLFGQLSESIDYTKNGDERDFAAADKMQMIASKRNPDVYYIALVEKSTSNEWTLMMCKFDFKKNTHVYGYLVYDNKSMKDLEKAYVPFDKKIDKPDIYAQRLLDVRNISEVDGKLLISVSARYTKPGQYADAICEKSLLINGFDQDLNLLYQQQMPSSCGNFLHYLDGGYHVGETTLDIAEVYDNNKFIVGSLNATTGQWNNLYTLKRLDDYYPYPQNAMWINGGVILSYYKFKGLTKTNADISLQLINR